MTPEAFTAWIDSMRDRFGWKQKNCAAALGVRDTQISRWKERGTAHYVGIACQAILEAAEAGGPRPAAEPAPANPSPAKGRRTRGAAA